MKQGTLATYQKREPAAAPGPPFPLNSADNGLSVDPITGRIVLGQVIGEAGNPAQLLSDREIPLAGFNFSIGISGDRRFLIDVTNNNYQLGDIDGIGNGFNVEINDGNDYIYIGDTFGITSGAYIEISSSGGRLINTANDNAGQYFSIDALNNLYQIGDISGNSSGIMLYLDDVNGIASMGDVNAVNQNYVFETNDGAERGRFYSNSNFAYLLDMDFTARRYRIGEFDNGTEYLLDIDQANDIAVIRLGEHYLSLDKTNSQYRLGDIDGANNGSFVDVNDNALFMSVTLVGNNAGWVFADGANQKVDIGDINNTGNNTMLRTDDAAQIIEARHNLVFKGFVLDFLNLRYQLGTGSGTEVAVVADGTSGRVSTVQFDQMIGSEDTPYANGAAAAAATLLNAPAAGNPTKWIPINDNGTVRHIPAW